MLTTDVRCRIDAKTKAEAAKVIENTQRDLNIALTNELSVILGRLNLDTLDLNYRIMVPVVLLLVVLIALFLLLKKFGIINRLLYKVTKIFYFLLLF